MALVNRNGWWYVRIMVSSSPLRFKWKSLKTKDRPERRKWVKVEDALWAEHEKSGGHRPNSPDAAIAKAIDSYLAELRKLQRSPRYVERMAYVLGCARIGVGACSIDGWTKDAIEQHLAAEAKRTRKRVVKGKLVDTGKLLWRSGRTYNLHCECIKHFMRWCQARGWLPPGAVAAQLITKASVVRRQPQAHDPAATKAIIDACHEHDKRLRKRRPWIARAVRVAFGTGARLGELQAMRWEDVDFNGNAVKLFGKGRKERRVPMTADARAALETVAQAERSGLVFAEIKRKDDRSLGSALRHAGLPHCGWHALRHSYVTLLMRAGVPLAVVQSLAGHKNIQTTMGYVHVAGSDLSDAVKKLDAYTNGYTTAS